MPKLNFNYSKIPLYIFTLTFLILLPDMFRSGDIISKIFHIDSRIIFAISLSLIVLIRLKSEFLIREINQKLIGLLSLLFLIFGTTFSILGYLYPANYLYSITHLFYQQFILIGIFSLIFWTLSNTNKWFINNHKTIILISGFILFNLGLVVSLFPFEYFIKISQEDHLIENSQVGVLFIGFIFSVNYFINNLKNQKYFESFFFLLASLVLFFLMGEEISWGQRIFHVITPQFFAKNNYQDEVSIHNLYVVNKYIAFSYVLIGFYGSVSWLAEKLFSKFNQKLNLFIVPSYLSIYFFIVFCFDLFFLTHFNSPVGRFSEFVELHLYLGIMFFIYSKSPRKNL